MAEVVSSSELFNNAPNSNLPPFDVVVPKGVDPEAMAKDIVGGKIDVSNLNTLVSSKELFGDETPTIKTVSSADLFKDEKPVTPKVTPKREKTLTDKVIGFAQKYLGDQTSAETGSGEATKGFVQGLSSVASGGASWIPAGLSMTPITLEGKQGASGQIKLRSPQEMADTARAIQESLTYTPKDKSAREFAEALAKPITYVIEKGKDSGDYYKKLGDEAEARGEHKTAKLLWALGGATEVGGEALPFAVPYAAGKGLKAVKGAIKAPEIDLGKVSEKPTSITPDVSAELKASVPKEVKAPEVKAGPVEKVEPAANVDPLIAEARKYKTAEEFVNSRPIFEHETNAEFDKFDLSKAGSGQGEAWLGKGIYLQEKGSFKLEKYGNKKIESGLTPEANIFEIKDTPNGKYRDNFVEYAVNNNIGSARALAEQRIKDGLSLDNLLPRDILRNNPNAVEQLKKAGFDGLLEDGELVVYNPDVLKTKADLTSIWNKAQEGKGKPTANVEGKQPWENKQFDTILKEFERPNEPSLINAQWEKITVPLESLRGNNKSLFDGKWVLGEDSKTIGEIILDHDGKIIDGNHRVSEALKRGDKNIVILRPKKYAEGNKAQEGKGTPKVEVKTEIPVEGKPAKAALDINKDLIDKGFEGLPERELARYNTIQKAEEVGKAQALASNPDFFEMAKGNKPLPEDVHPQVLFNVAINEATKAGNIDMLMDLAKSPIAEQRSLAAQQLGASAWEKPVNNIVKTINEVKKVRESKIKNPKVKEVVKTKLREEVSKVNLTKEDLSWEKFLDKIEC